jgi:hypothetical protein
MEPSIVVCIRLSYTVAKLTLIAWILASQSVLADSSDSVEYSRDIKPLLKAKCYSCHGALRQEAGLRLDSVANMKIGGDSGPALNIDKLLDSHLLSRITASDESERMPPEGEPMSLEQIERVKTWLNDGAKSPADEKTQVDPRQHWAFQPVKNIQPPGDGHPVDGFVDASLEAAGLHRSPRANTVSLIRRMFLDLHGLPPSPQQIDHWTHVFDTETPDVASRKLVDELLESPRYGERWAQHWLDIVRYADTHGYEVNTPRPNAWPYRDYVIRAFNEDRPYDRFVIEQLAGDTVGEDAATGFLVTAAALLPGQIGQDDASKRLARQDELDEIIIGTTATFLGLTVGCARCHDHKFDPIPQEDYYAIQSFFAGVQYGDREIRGEEFQRRVTEADALQPRIDELRQQLSQHELRASTGLTLIIDDEDMGRVSVLKAKNGHGTNPDGTARGYLNDVGDADRVGNLSRGRYTWWDNTLGEDVFTWNPATAGRFRIWISWGVHGSGVHTHDARYVLDIDGDLSTTSDQQEIARSDQLHFAYENSGETEMKPLWSGLFDAGEHQLTTTSRLILRCGETETGITADVIVLQQVDDSQSLDLADSAPPRRLLPALRMAVNARHNVEHFAARPAKFVRFTSLETVDDNRHEPCLDELEVFSTQAGAPNIGLAKLGTVATSSGNISNAGIHQLPHINDGNYGNNFSWISNEHGKGWVQLEFRAVTEINRVEWGRDRTEGFKDRLPVRYHIETSVDGRQWTTVATSDDRVPMGTPHDSRWALVRSSRAHSSQSADQAANQDDVVALSDELSRLEQRQAELRKPDVVFAGTFQIPNSTFLLNRGDPEQPLREVQPHVVTSLGTLELENGSTDQQRRTQLANWIASPDHPLTARVIVNRIWQSHFGLGIVPSPSDFGLNGMSPSHPDLLDWLAQEFVANNWSIKHLHRLIMSSETYQQSTTWQPTNTNAVEPLQIDAGNVLMWRFPGRRIEAEAIRDCILQVSGQLNLKMGGPGFDFFQSRGGLSGFPPVEEFTPNELRRMIYAHKVRMEPVPVFGAFDCPDAGLPTPRRSQSTTAIQALNLFNSSFVVDQATVFAERLWAESPESMDEQIRLAFRISLGRLPTDEEMKLIHPVVEQNGLQTLCRSLFNSNEFLFIP